MIKNKFIVWIIYFFGFILMLISFINCSNYEVVSKIKENLYHLHNIKMKKSEIILTNDSLIIGVEYKLKNINIINSPYYKK